MSDTDILERIARLLAEIRDNQRTQLERQTESLDIQKEQYQIVLKQHDKTGQLQQRAEAIQDRSAKLINSIHRFVPIALAVVAVLIGYISWLLFRYFR